MSMLSAEILEQLPEYRSHKIVRAAKIVVVDLAGRVDGPQNTIALRVDRGDGRIIDIDVPAFLCARQAPVPGDWLMAHADGYLSVSPDKAFVEGYSREGQVGSLEAADRAHSGDQADHCPKCGATGTGAMNVKCLNAGCPKGGYWKDNNTYVASGVTFTNVAHDGDRKPDDNPYYTRPAPPVIGLK